MGLVAEGEGRRAGFRGRVGGMQSAAAASASDQRQQNAASGAGDPPSRTGRQQEGRPVIVLGEARIVERRAAVLKKQERMGVMGKDEAVVWRAKT